MNGVAVMLRRFRSFCKLRTDVYIFKIGVAKDYILPSFSMTGSRPQVASASTFAVVFASTTDA